MTTGDTFKLDPNEWRGEAVAAADQLWKLIGNAPAGETLAACLKATVDSYLKERQFPATIANRERDRFLSAVSIEFEILRAQRLGL